MDHASCAGYCAIEVGALSDSITAVKCQRGVVCDRAADSQITRGRAASDLQSSRVDHCRSRIGIGPCQNKISTTHLDQTTRARDCAIEVGPLGNGIAAIEGQRGVVCDCASGCETARGRATSNLKRSSRYCCATRMGIVS